MSGPGTVRAGHRPDRGGRPESRGEERAAGSGRLTDRPTGAYIGPLPITNKRSAALVLDTPAQFGSSIIRPRVIESSEGLTTACGLRRPRPFVPTRHLQARRSRLYIQ